MALSTTGIPADPSASATGTSSGGGQALPPYLQKRTPLPAPVNGSNSQPVLQNMPTQAPGESVPQQQPKPQPQAGGVPGITPMGQQPSPQPQSPAQPQTPAMPSSGGQPILKGDASLPGGGNASTQVPPNLPPQLTQKISDSGVPVPQPAAQYAGGMQNTQALPGQTGAANGATAASGQPTITPQAPSAPAPVTDPNSPIPAALAAKKAAALAEPDALTNNNGGASGPVQNYQLGTDTMQPGGPSPVITPANAATPPGTLPNRQPSGTGLGAPTNGATQVPLPPPITDGGAAPTPGGAPGITPFAGTQASVTPPVNADGSAGTPTAASSSGNPDLDATFNYFKSQLDAQRNTALQNSITDAQSRGVYYGTPLTTSQGDIQTSYLQGLGSLEANMFNQQQQNQLGQEQLAVQLVNGTPMAQPQSGAGSTMSALGSAFAGQGVPTASSSPSGVSNPFALTPASGPPPLSGSTYGASTGGAGPTAPAGQQLPQSGEGNTVDVPGFGNVPLNPDGSLPDWVKALNGGN